MLGLLLLSFLGVFIGGYFKIQGNWNADFILAGAILFKVTAVFGLLYFNRRKILSILS
ncbi:MAG: hypothetical protein RLZZ358_38 [Bacteroidota bacterium]|jgi:hypothetical protein